MVMPLFLIRRRQAPTLFLPGADLRAALERAVARGIPLTGAGLQAADLQGARLAGADLTGAILDGQPDGVS